MRLLIFILITAAICISGYLFLNAEKSVTTTLSTNPKTTSDNPNAQQHISALTHKADQPISIETADNFVTAEQLLHIPNPTSDNTADITPETAPETTPASPTNAETDTFAVTSHLNVIKNPQQPKNNHIPSLTTIPTALKNQIKLQELLDNPDQSSQKVYFIHAVNEGDDEGLWGIIQHGLMKTFTAGLTLPGLDKTVSVHIPKEADEKLDDKRSSFLGQVLKNKVDKTYIYNYQKGILGDNPNLIKPGQQLIIVTFTEQELIDIYEHFTSL